MSAERQRRSGATKRPPARERILAAAVRRIASDGIDDVRIARIAMDAGVSPPLVHYHFDSRETLLAEALELLVHARRRRADLAAARCPRPRMPSGCA